VLPVLADLWRKEGRSERGGNTIQLEGGNFFPRRKGSAFLSPGQKREKKVRDPPSLLKEKKTSSKEKIPSHHLARERKKESLAQRGKSVPFAPGKSTFFPMFLLL